MATAFKLPLRVICLLPIFLLANSFVFADGTHYSVIHARLEMKDGSVKTGYFNLSTDKMLIYQDETGPFYYSYKSRRLMRLHPVDSTSQGMRPAAIDYHFSHEIHYLMQDSLDLFVNARVVNISTSEYPEVLPIAAMLGSPAKVAKNDIAYVSVQSFQEICTYATTKFTQEDISWIEPPVVFRENAGEYDICSIEALSFQKPGAAALALLNELRTISENFRDLPESEKDYAKLVLRHAAIIEKLRQQQIIIITFCSC